MLKRFLILLLAAPLIAHATPSGFSLTDMQGKTHTLAGHQGKWVLVNLWATWCAPCLGEMPELEALGKSRGDLVILGVAVDGQSPRRVAQFVEKLHVTYPVVAGDEELAKQFKPRGFPTSILYDPAGKPVLTKEGVITRKDIESALH
ncbi:MAG TPA: TlpA disulfide reductase family protein [Noviherbaspirillum sp.]|uniref:TlpA family protein disulfide reductase n=1 Tax=Noviherbaspirillum sp. TaxID=1926288 RepID=UPI002B46CCBD|nr:TlpA disulfide reductase family protein [Noviherbaspirillum sp.]HJV88589.1 TlpA disulfide reductase family protein [Noviherbaspirillum sp.]